MRDKQAYVPSIKKIGRSVKLPTITRYCDFLVGFNVLYEYGRTIAGSIYRGCSELLTHIFGIYIYPQFYQRPDVHLNVMIVRTGCTQRIDLRYCFCFCFCFCLKPIFFFIIFTIHIDTSTSESYIHVSVRDEMFANKLTFATLRDSVE